MSSDFPHQSPTKRNSRANLFRWLAAGMVLVLAVTILAVHVPARAKLIGLFSLGHGLLAGWLLGKLAQTTGLRLSRWTRVVAFLLIAAGQCGLVAESHRLHRAAMMQQFERTDSPQSFQKAPMRRLLRETTSFSAYLQYRISQLGHWPKPWPMIFWSCEALLASAAGTWLMTRILRAESP